MLGCTNRTCHWVTRTTHLMLWDLKFREVRRQGRPLKPVPPTTSLLGAPIHLGWTEPAVLSSSPSADEDREAQPTVRATVDGPKRCVLCKGTREG